MRIGVYSDPHFNKKMQYQEQWETSVLTSFTNMYKEFKYSDLDMVVCCGDFFDKSILEARHVSLLNSLKGIMEDSGLCTYLLLGNHEIDSSDHNILDIMNSPRIHPITKLTRMPNALTFIPYSVQLEDIPTEYIDNRVVFSHHDIYGSSIAGGKVKASFGSNPELLTSAKRVFNGHIHLRSSFGNITNVGSLFTSQFGELTEGAYDTPCYYIYDSETDILKTYSNMDSLFYITVHNEEKDSELLKKYIDASVPIVIRVMYKESMDETSYIPPVTIMGDQVISTVYRKEVSKSVASTEIVKTANLDIKEMVTKYINQDTTIIESCKPRVLDKVMKMLGGN